MARDERHIHVDTVTRNHAFPDDSQSVVRPKPFRNIWERFTSYFNRGIDKVNFPFESSNHQPVLQREISINPKFWSYFDYIIPFRRHRDRCLAGEMSLLELIFIWMIFLNTAALVTGFFVTVFATQLKTELLALLGVPLLLGVFVLGIIISFYYPTVVVRGLWAIHKKDERAWVRNLSLWTLLFFIPSHIGLASYYLFGGVFALIFVKAILWSLLTL